MAGVLPPLRLVGNVSAGPSTLEQYDVNSQISAVSLVSAFKQTHPPKTAMSVASNAPPHPGLPPGSESGFVPGYRGFVPGSQHYYASTYGSVTRAATANPNGPGDREGVTSQYPRSPRTDLPGYMGYMPGSKFKYAKTFGSTTVELKEESIAPASPTTPTKPTSGRKGAPSPRRPMTSSHIPGYSGFIRGSQHYFGDTYAAMTRAANDSPGPKPRARQPAPFAIPQEGGLPGYAGFIRSSQHCYGCNYSEMTRQAKRMSDKFDGDATTHAQKPPPSPKAE